MIAEPLLARFDADLARILPRDIRVGLAVSGGPDSVALLLLAAASRAGLVEAATIDHGLRPESPGEGAIVAAVCARLGVPHAILQVEVPRAASLQAQAREVRYAALARWAQERELPALLTAHHMDDQAETLLMRLARGSGLAGLAGVRSQRRLGDKLLIGRPLLDWRKSELMDIIRSEGINPVQDPANCDPRHDRTRARNFLASQEWLEPHHLAASASHLAEAEEALAFAAERLFAERHRVEGRGILLETAGLPRELQRRLLLRALERLGAAQPRGADLDRALTRLGRGGVCTLGGMKLEGGSSWRLLPAPPRRQFAPKAAP